MYYHKNSKQTFKWPSLEPSAGLSLKDIIETLYIVYIQHFQTKNVSLILSFRYQLLTVFEMQKTSSPEIWVK